MNGLGSAALRRRLWARLRPRTDAQRAEPVWAGLGTSEGVRCWVELPNASTRADAFEVPADALLDLLAQPLQIKAWLHVHPTGSGRMSARDEAGAFVGGEPAWPEVEWVVLAADGSGTRNLLSRAGLRTRPFTNFCGSEEA